MKWVERENAANVLFDNDFYNESVIVYWQCVRNIVFRYLYIRGIEYSSTRDALKEIIILLAEKKSTLARKISFFEVIATLAEWDTDKGVTKIQAQELKDFYFEFKTELDTI